MNLGFFERLYVNGGFRKYLHQPYIAKWLFGQVNVPIGGHALEVGCGAGRGIGFIQQHLQPHHTVGSDFDPTQVTRAKMLWKNNAAVSLKQADASQLPFDDKAFHAVVSFGAIHHVPNWEAALAEINRVLKPGGYVFLEEYYRGFLHFPLTKWLAPHPPQRFNHSELVLALAAHGLRPVAHQHSIIGVYGLVVAQKI